MNNKLKQFLIHFLLYLFERIFAYLHKAFDVYYDYECQKFVLEEKKVGDDDEKSSI